MAEMPSVPGERNVLQGIIVRSTIKFTRHLTLLSVFIRTLPQTVHTVTLSGRLGLLHMRSLQLVESVGSCTGSTLELNIHLGDCICLEALAL